MTNQGWPKSFKSGLKNPRNASSTGVSGGIPSAPGLFPMLGEPPICPIPFPFTPGCPVPTGFGNPVSNLGLANPRFGSYGRGGYAIPIPCCCPVYGGYVPITLEDGIPCMED